jgi:hypothetical protein
MSDDSRKVKIKGEVKEERRSGSATPEDGQLAIWIQRLWENDESPQKIHVVQLMKRGEVLGSIIDREDFPSSKLIDADRAAELANRFLMSAQNDCDRVVRKPQSYGVIAYDTAKATEPYRRYPMFLHPKASYLAVSRSQGGGLSADGDDDEEQLDAKTISLQYTKTQIEALQFDKQHYSAVFGDMFALFREEVREQRTWIGELMGQNKAMFAEVISALRQREEALSSAEDRAAKREWQKMKMALAQDGMRTARNLLPALFGASQSPAPTQATANVVSQQQGQVAAGQAQPQVAAASTTPVEYPMTPERTLVDNFLHDCEQTNISVKMFGDWKEEGDKMILVERGIFDPEQFAVFMRVRNGLLPASALDDLLPDSGKPISIRQEQIEKAMPIMSEGVGMSIFQLISLRKQAQEAATSNQG